MNHLINYGQKILYQGEVDFFAVFTLMLIC